MGRSSEDLLERKSEIAQQFWKKDLNPLQSSNPLPEGPSTKNRSTNSIPKIAHQFRNERAFFKNLGFKLFMLPRYNGGPYVQNDNIWITGSADEPALAVYNRISFHFDISF